MKKLGRLVIFILISIFTLASISKADIKENVSVVKPMYFSKTIGFLNDIGDYISGGADNSVSDYFYSFGKGGVWGSGFLIEKEGEYFIVTNSHVIDQAETAMVVFEKNTDGFEQYEYCTIEYQDDNIDLAIIKLPDNFVPPKKRLKIRTDFIHEKTHVFSAGFPSMFNRPAWQITEGVISNEKIFVPEVVDPNITYLIQHTSPIDRGNSGGPLLFEDTSNGEYGVIGINTWQIIGRQNTNFAIPALNIEKLLKKVYENRKMKNNPDMIRKSIRDTCLRMIQVATEEKIYLDDFKKFLSNRFVADQGYSSYMGVIENSHSAYILSRLEGELFEDPLDAIKTAVAIHVLKGIRETDDIPDIKFEGITEKSFSADIFKKGIDTNFKINGETMKITWIFENGNWRIGYIKLKPLVIDEDTEKNEGVEDKKDFSTKKKSEAESEKVTTPPEENPIKKKKPIQIPQPEQKIISNCKIKEKENIEESNDKYLFRNGTLLLGFGINAGYAGVIIDYGDGDESYGDNIVPHWSFGIAADYYFANGVSISTGINYSKKGNDYDGYVDPDVFGFDWIEVEEDLRYIEVPILLKFNRKFSLSVGIGLNFLVSSAAMAYTGDKQTLYFNKQYFDNLTDFSASFIINGEILFRFGKRILMSLLLGADYHMGSDWKNIGFDLRYFTVYIGLYNKFFLIRK